MCKFIGKCVSFLCKFSCFLVTNRSIIIASFITALGASVGHVTLFNTKSFTISNGFVKCFLSKVKIKILNIKSWNNAKSKLGSVKEFQK